VAPGVVAMWDAWASDRPDGPENRDERLALEPGAARDEWGLDRSAVRVAARLAWASPDAEVPEPALQASRAGVASTWPPNRDAEVPLAAPPVALRAGGRQKAFWAAPVRAYLPAAAQADPGPPVSVAWVEAEAPASSSQGWANPPNRCWPGMAAADLREFVLAAAPLGAA
jgi:hypothetical protein